MFGAIFCIVFYIPSRVGPDEITKALLEEHAVAAELWGANVEDGVRTRALNLQEAAARLVLASSASTATP